MRHSSTCPAHRGLYKHRTDMATCTALRSHPLVVATALGVGVIVVYLLLPLRSSVTLVAKPFVQQRRHAEAPEGPVLAKAASGFSDNASTVANPSNSVKRYRWPAEASSKAHGRGALLTTTPIEGCSSWIDKCSRDCVDGEGIIPRTVFFVKVDDNFIFRDWLAVMSAVKIIKANAITVFSAKPLRGCWWKRTLPFVKHEIVPGNGWVTKQNGVVVEELAHKADFFRVEALYRLGGIYMDTDAIALKSFEPLLNNHNVVLAKQPGGGANCGLMLARRQSCFMCSYMKQSCERFDGGWVSHSNVILMGMQQQGFKPHHGVLLLEMKHGFYPFGWSTSDFHKTYDTNMDNVPFKLTQAFALHLWNHVGSLTDFPKKLYDYSWLTKSPSVAARALRRLLPQGFSEEHMNESLCSDLPDDYML